MDGGDSGSAGVSEGGGGTAEAEPTSSAAPRPDAAAEFKHPAQTPLYHAHHADRYQRQELIEAYEARTGSKFVAAIDVIDIDFVQNVEEHLHREPGDREVHLLLRSPGGLAEVAVRAIRAVQARCSKLVLLVPDMAKSAATIFALGADEIRLGPASDLGPIDPQMQVGGRWHAAKAIIRAVEQAETAVAANRTLTPLWASLLAEVTALDYQAAKAELARTETMVSQAIGYRTRPPEGDEFDQLVAHLVQGLQDTPTSHATTMGPRELGEMGLPIIEMDPCSWEWECIWRLWTLYWVQISGPIYESRHASFRPEGPHPA